MSQPSVLVVIPVKNRPNVILRAIKSVLNQNYGGIMKLAVVDDGSDDETTNILTDFEKSCDIEIKVHRNKISMGAAYSRNLGSDMYDAEYIAFLDSDDEWLSDHLSRKIDLIERENMGGVYGRFFINRHNTKSIRPKKVNTKLDVPNRIFNGDSGIRTSSFILNKKKFDHVRFDEELYKHQDWDLAIRFSEIYKFGFDKKPTVILHVDSSGRMSYSLNLPATERLIKRHSEKIDQIFLVKYYIKLSLYLLRTNQDHDNFRNIMHKTKNLLYKNHLKLLKSSPRRLIQYYLMRVLGSKYLVLDRINN